MYPITRVQILLRIWKGKIPFDRVVVNKELSVEEAAGMESMIEIGGDVTVRPAIDLSIERLQFIRGLCYLADLMMGHSLIPEKSLHRVLLDKDVAIIEVFAHTDECKIGEIEELGVIVEPPKEDPFIRFRITRECLLKNECIRKPDGG